MADKISFDEINLGFELPMQSKSITQEKITKNAEASLDYNPIHIDPEYAKKINLLGKGTTIAHGMMTLSFMGKIVTDWVYPGGGFMKSLEGKFFHPVRPNDELKVYAKIIEKHPRPKKEENFLVLDVWCEINDGIKVSAGTAAVIIPN
ncbi:MAG: MaoC family dehydratase [Proteobacteria bacterium]|nr:MaoC family dehydratase [Pseudomonadota bacterium]